jgi:hypothetical protein
MAKADYILCDRCDSKIVYDGEGKIMEGLAALGLDRAPALCEACRTAPAYLQSGVEYIIEAEANRVTTDDAPDEMAPVESSIWVMGYKAALERIAAELRAAVEAN